MTALSSESICRRGLALWVLFCGALTISLSPALEASADEQGWVLTQRSEKVGDQYVYVASNGVKLVNPKAGYNIVLCAPDWNVCIYNDKTQSYYSASYSEWMKEMDRAVGGKGNPLKEGRWAKSQASNICGLRATSYVMQGSGQRNLRNATCWVSNDIVVPSQITDLLAKAYGLPDNKAYPLKVNTVDKAGHLTMMLDTYDSRAVPIPSSYFYLPNGYKRVASKEEVMMDDDTKAILRDLANDSPGSLGSSQSAGQAASSTQVYRQQPAARPQATYQQPVFQQQTHSQYAQPTQSQAQAQPQQQAQAQPAATPGVLVLPNGQTLDREKVRKIIEVLKNGGKPTTP